VYPVLPPQRASGEILRVGVEIALLDVRVVTVDRVVRPIEDKLNVVVKNFDNEEATTELDKSNATLEEPDVALRDPEVTLEEPDVVLRDPEVALRDPEVALRDLEMALEESIPELAELDAELRLDCEATLLKLVVAEDDNEDEVDWRPAPLETLILTEAVELCIEEGMVDDGAALLADDDRLEL
jgi:hypothetical protein